MSSINEELLKTIKEFISSQSSTIDKKELMAVIKDFFSAQKKSKKDENSEKPKRKPSAYNIFMKNTMKDLKENGMTAKEKMKQVAEMWKEFKTTQQNKVEIENENNEAEEIFEDVSEVIVVEQPSTDTKKKNSTKKK